jgi:hypothetical protein
MDEAIWQIVAAWRFPNRSAEHCEGRIGHRARLQRNSRICLSPSPNLPHECFAHSRRADTLVQEFENRRTGCISQVLKGHG